MKLDQSGRLHSPSPWAIDCELPPNPRSVIARTTGGVAISANTVGPHDPAHDKHNARIIALAPEMLDAIAIVEGCFRTCEEDDSALDEIMEAVGVRKVIADIFAKLKKTKR